MTDNSGLSYDENGRPLGVQGEQLSESQLQAKADQFDASHANPRQYAQDNFGAHGAALAAREEAYRVERENQRQQQIARQQEQQGRGRHRR